jgi:hypothetical protein
MNNVINPVVGNMAKEIPYLSKVSMSFCSEPDSVTVFPPPIGTLRLCDLLACVSVNRK